MRIAHFQLACTPGDTQTNTEAVIGALTRAARDGVDIVRSPESFLTGYFSDVDQARSHSLATDGPEITHLLEMTCGLEPAFIVGFNERRGENLYNTVLVAERGRLLGTYSKAFPCFDYFTPGREFPLFYRGQVAYGVIICADGGYIEPARILALKGARVIFAPHYNYLPALGLINHLVSVRADHVARARENGVWFLRGNNVTRGDDRGLDPGGVGYGDSYLLDPLGEIVVRGPRHVEHMMVADIAVEDSDLHKTPFFSDTRARSVESGKALGGVVAEALAAAASRCADPVAGV